MTVIRNATRAAIAAALVAAPVTVGVTAHAATRAATSVQGICDIYAAGGTPCVAANSTTHALFAAYSGPLYTVTRDSDSTSLVINTVTAGGVADVAAQDTFCKGTVCRITDIADQTPYNNDLVPSPKGGNGGPVQAAVANAAPATLGGQKVYGVATWPGYGGYADDSTYMIPTGSQPEETMMVASGIDTNNGCCYDYGNGETNRLDNGAGHMEAANLGSAGAAPGTDLENGIFNAGDTATYDNVPFVSVMESSNGTTAYSVSSGNAQAGALTHAVAHLPTGYYPMHKEGGMVLGVGGDISNTGTGIFYEGVITSGSRSATTEDAVQAQIVSEGYGL